VNIVSRVTIYVDGEGVEDVMVDGEGDFQIQATVSPISPSSKIENGGTIAMSQIVVIVVALSTSDRADGILLLLGFY